MNIAKLRADLELDEGISHVVYVDHLGLKTCGIGHLCLEGEPEYDMEVGTAISDDRVQILFERDLDMVRLDCLKLYPNFDSLPDDTTWRIPSGSQPLPSHQHQQQPSLA